MHNHPIPDPDSNPPTRRRFLQGAGGALSSPLWAGLLGCGGNGKVQLREARKKAAHRRRRIILDDDGDLCYSDDAKKSIEAFLQQRLKPAAELPIDSIAWCIMWGIAIGKGETRYWETQQQGKALNSVLPDPTPIMVEAGREHDIEIFGSMRMNDTHDSYGMPAGKLIYPLKVQHPEWLIGDESQKGEVFSTQEAATWSGLDFAIPEVREDRFWWIRNSVENYDLAGLDLNFFRMPWYFKPGKEEEGMPLMTELIRSAREVVDRASESKGEPVLLGVRTPGTVDTCRRIGIDIETWLQEGLVDRLLIGGGYTPFNNPAEELVNLGHRHEVPVYPCINCGTHIFGSDAAFRGAASNILWAGGDGIYLWNFHYRKAPQISYGRPQPESYEVLNHIASKEGLKHRDKRFAVDYVQVTSVMGNAGPYSYACSPGQVPAELDGKATKEIQLRVGDDVAAAESSGHLDRAELLLEIGNWSEGDKLSARLNDGALESADTQPAPKESTTSEETAFQLRYSVEGSRVRQGINQLQVVSQREGSPPHAEESRAGSPISLKEQIPRYKVQTSSKSQAPNSKQDSRRLRLGTNLALGIRLYLGIWCLELVSLRQTMRTSSWARTVQVACILLTLLHSGCGDSPETETQGGPNIVLVMTDDQGWAQVGSHGNESIATPNLDRLASQSVEFTRFYVSPVCAPTRASLMTGRYNYRTGVVDTYVGRAMMHSDEATLAEMLSQAGYRTGIFGKWHLGDNYPMRTIDQGFEESLVHKGGGIGQPSDPLGNSYFDPVLQLNGQPRKYEGYCTDIFFDAALEFIQENREKSFFAYIPTNAPHSPYDVPDSYIQPYLGKSLNEKDARIYGMITNIDENVGRLMKKLEELQLDRDTILIFMTDNGPTTQHFTAGLRERKTTIFEGGIRVPFFFRWPDRMEPSRIGDIAAHIDLLPTLLEAVGVDVAADVSLDGISLLARMDGREDSLPDRTLYIQSHRGNVPQLYRNFAAIGSRYKLLQPLSFSDKMPPNAELQLYDLDADPGESRDLSAELPEVVDRMRQGYETWFREVSTTRGYSPPRIAIGTAHEDPVVLTRQDWQMVGKDGWGDSDLGYWKVSIANGGAYQIRFRFGPFEQSGEAELRIQNIVQTQPFGANATEVTFESAQLATGDARLEAKLKKGGQIVGVRYVDVSALQR